MGLVQSPDARCQCSGPHGGGAADGYTLCGAVQDIRSMFSCVLGVVVCGAFERLTAKQEEVVVGNRAPGLDVLLGPGRQNESQTSQHLSKCGLHACMLF